MRGWGWMSTTIPARIGDLWAFFVDLMDCDGFFFPFFSCSFLLFALWFLGGFCWVILWRRCCWRITRYPTRYLGREIYIIGTCRYWWMMRCQVLLRPVMSPLLYPKLRFSLFFFFFFCFLFQYMTWRMGHFPECGFQIYIFFSTNQILCGRVGEYRMHVCRKDICIWTAYVHVCTLCIVHCICM